MNTNYYSDINNQVVFVIIIVTIIIIIIIVILLLLCHLQSLLHCTGALISCNQHFKQNISITFLQLLFA